jgi:hypothetical protein
MPGAADTVAVSGIGLLIVRGAEGATAACAAASTATAVHSRGPAGEYSTKVPQPARTWTDWSACCRTVTCGDGRRWMGCLLMACKRSGVRIPIAPQFRNTIRKKEPRIKAEYSSKVQQQADRTPVRIRSPRR